MSDARKNVTVRIMGKEYTFRSGDDPEYLRTLASYVDGKMRGISRGSANMPLADSAILAAVNIADELHRSRRQLAEAAAVESPKGRGAAAKGKANATQWKEVHESIQSILELFPK